MNSLIIFEEQVYLYITLFSLLFFLACGIYVSIDQKSSALVNGIKCLTIGFAIDFIAIWFGSMMDGLNLYVSAQILMMFALMLKLIVLVLYGMAATYMMLGNVAIGLYSFLAFVFGMACVIYCTVLSPNGVAINILYSLFPAIGLAYLTAACFTRCFRKYNVGYIIACADLAYVTSMVATHISDETIFSMQIWYVGAVAYLGMGIAFLLILVDMKNDDLDNASKKIMKYDMRMKEIVKLSPFPIMISRLSDDTILSANDNFLKLFGLTNKDLEYRRFKDFFVDENNRRLLNSHLEKERIVKDFEILVKAPNSESPFWLSTSANIIDYDYNIAIYAAFQDITDRRKREDVLRTQATRDPLTSLFNRRYFEEEVNRRIELNPSSRFCVFMIDADHFKSVNDTYGHKVGDKVLIALAETVQKALRDKDIVARYGGEEFVVYLANSDEKEAKLVADRVRESISQLTVYSDANEPFHFTVSIGISSSQYSKKLGELVKMSDDALYEAKETGRNRCVVYHADMVSEPQAAKQEKAEENVHPAFSKENNVEVSLLDGHNAEDKA
ncbi:MAG: sensor domain-containing diguanylate cyclase [Alphaproteobacteria bacterium]|nr:sensor domain-containing diguanylate cyclase [Alphaproteobacteria bacterium]